MSGRRATSPADVIVLAMVVAAALLVRAWYLCVCAGNGHHDGPIHVQDAWPLLTSLPAGTEMLMAAGDKPQKPKAAA